MAQELHVATNGNDDWPGTADKPLATLVAARDKARTLIVTMDEDIAILLHAGTHRLPEPLTLHGEHDSGRNGK